MKASIIVLTHNSSKYLELCIDSILENKDRLDELIIIDNNSNDSTKEILSKYKDKAQIYLLSRNLKISYSRNLGAKYAKNDLLIFIDSDLVLDKESLRKAKDSYKINQAVALFGYYREKGTGYNWYIEMIRDVYSPKRKKNFSKEINYKNFACLSGGLCLIDKNTFFCYLGFNTYYDNSPSEDIDLELKLIRDKQKIIYEKEFSGIHYKGYLNFKNLVKKYIGNGKALTRLIKQSFKNNYKIPFNNRWPYLPIISLLELIILMLSYHYNFFLIVFCLLVMYRIIPIISVKNYSLNKKIQFIIIRYILDYFMLFTTIKNLIFSKKNISKMEFNVKKISKLEVIY